MTQCSSPSLPLLCPQQVGPRPCTGYLQPPGVRAPQGQRLDLSVLLPQPQPLAVPGTQQGLSRRATRSFPGARLSAAGAGAESASSSGFSLSPCCLFPALDA